MPESSDHADVDHSADIALLKQHYGKALDEFGDSPGAVQQSSWETQERRFAVLADVAALDLLRDADVLDFGCGLGHIDG